jgi:hypothetical protein
MGNREMALKVKNIAKNFLEKSLNLTLSEEKTKITNLNKDKAKFLGVYFHTPRSKEPKIILRKIKDERSNIYSRINFGKIKFLLPYKEIKQKLIKEEFLIPDGRTTNAIKR